MEKNNQLAATFIDNDECAYVKYWSVYNQGWTRAYAQSDIPDREWAAASAEDCEVFKKLPKEI